MIAIDTNSNVSGHLGGLRARGVTAVGRYYASSAWKRLTRAEATEIGAAGIAIFTVFEDDGDPDLTHDMGLHHAQIALVQANAVGQPKESAIYFALEHLPSGYKKKHLKDVITYVQGVKDGLGGQYRLGVYSDGIICQGLLEAGLCDYTWLSASLSFEGSKDFLKSGRWSIAQDPHVDQNWDGLSIDLNQVRDDFGGFHIGKPAASMASGAMVLEVGGEDPARPGEGETSETAGPAMARVLANLGAPQAMEPDASQAPASGALSIDIGRAKAFLEACMSSNPRVTYGLGKKVPFLGAVPGRDFVKVDCSGFVREAIRLSTSPRAKFPDGSVVQHDWVIDRGFAKGIVADGGDKDGVVRIAFLRPQDVTSGIGHVVLLHNGMTLESHGGTGPDSRPWTGEGWQAKTHVYLLGEPQSFAAMLEAPLPASFTVKQGHRYRATVRLQGLEQFATNDYVAQTLASYGFSDIKVTGWGKVRSAEGTWTGPDTTAELDAHLSDIVDLAA